MVTLAGHPSVLQVTIVSPEPGAASLKSTGTQGDMEKADMVDGEPAQRDQDPTHSILPPISRDLSHICSLRDQGEHMLGPTVCCQPSQELRVPCPLLPIPRTAAASW